MHECLLALGVAARILGHCEKRTLGNESQALPKFKHAFTIDSLKRKDRKSDNAEDWRLQATAINIALTNE